MNRTSVAFDINKSKWTNKHTFQDMVYVDTNSVIDIILQRRYGQVTEDYIAELVNRDGMITWSQHTIDEITQVIHVDEYKKLAKSKGNNNPRAWKTIENTVTDIESANVAQIVTTKVDKITSFLEQFGDKTDVDENDVNSMTKQIYINHGVNQQDSKHLAIANLTGTNNILTQDSGFLRFPDVNIFGASHGIVQNYNQGQNLATYVDLKELLLSSDTKKNDENVS